VHQIQSKQFAFISNKAIYIYENNTGNDLQTINLMDVMGFNISNGDFVITHNNGSNRFILKIDNLSFR